MNEEHWKQSIILLITFGALLIVTVVGVKKHIDKINHKLEQIESKIEAQP